MNLSDKLQDLKKWDNRRPSFPGEHWLALGAALMARGATGRDGPLSKLTELSDKPTRSTSQGVY